MLKRKWQVYLPSVPQVKALETMHAHVHSSTLLCMCLHKHTTFSPHARDVSRCNNLIGLLHLSGACVNCGEKLDGFTLYSPLILSELIPQTNLCGSLLSTNPVMPRRVFKRAAHSHTFNVFSQMIVQQIDARCILHGSQHDEDWHNKGDPSYGS